MGQAETRAGRWGSPSHASGDSVHPLGGAAWLPKPKLIWGERDRETQGWSRRRREQPSTPHLTKLRLRQGLANCNPSPVWGLDVFYRYDFYILKNYGKIHVT